MTVQLPNGSEFLHIPKTGGSWVTQVLQANNLAVRNVGNKHADFDRNLYSDRLGFSARQLAKVGLKTGLRRIKKELGFAIRPTKSPFRFCFVRHPLSWYESWWKYMNGNSWADWGTQNSLEDWHINSTLNGLGSPDFNTFVRNVIRARPGYVSELYFAFAKPGISFIGKTETLKADLESVLRHLELPYDPESLDSPRANQSAPPSEEIIWDSELRRLVTLLELPAIVHFGYLDAESSDLIGDSLQLEANPALQSLNS